MSTLILQSAAALMLLTAVVWTYMYYLRIQFIRLNKINPQNLISPEKANSVLPETIQGSSNNLKNLFELPIIFYALCLALQFTQLVDIWFIGLSWGYVVLRFAHSFIHCFNLKVLYRFYAYFASSVALWVIVVKFALMLM